MEENRYENDFLIVKKDQNIWIIEPKIRLDLSFSDHFYNQVLEFLQKDPNHIILNMIEVPYISSSGIKVLLKLKNFLEMRGYKLALFNLSKEVQKIIHISELHHLFPIFLNFEDCIKFIQT